MKREAENMDKPEQQDSEKPLFQTSFGLPLKVLLPNLLMVFLFLLSFSVSRLLFISVSTQKLDIVLQQWPIALVCITGTILYVVINIKISVLLFKDRISISSYFKNKIKDTVDIPLANVLHAENLILPFFKGLIIFYKKNNRLDAFVVPKETEQLGTLKSTLRAMGVEVGESKRLFILLLFEKTSILAVVMGVFFALIVSVF